MISIDYSLIIVVLNFLFLLYILNKYVYKNAKKYLENRRLVIKGDLNKANQSKIEASQLLETNKIKIKELMDTAIKEKRVIISKADAEANVIINNAKQREKKIKMETENQLIEEQKKATNLLKKRLSALIVQLSNKVISEKISKKDDETMILNLLSTKE